MPYSNLFSYYSTPSPFSIYLQMSLWYNRGMQFSTSCVCVGGGEETYYKQLQNLWVGIETLLRLESKFVKKQTGARDLSACLNIRIQKMQESSVNATSTCHPDDMADLRAVPRFCYTVCEACRPKIASKTKNRIHKKG